MQQRSSIREPLVFMLLLAVGVAGRWWPPMWNFTPLAAATAIGAFYFSSRLPAILLPIGILTISDLLLPAHDHSLVHASVYLMTIVPLLLGWAARRSCGTKRIACWALCGVAPATAFFLVTNFAVWAFKSDYPATLAGLMQSYYRGLPFYRAMLAGDVVYVTILVGCLAIAGQFDPQILRPRKLSAARATVDCQI